MDKYKQYVDLHWWSGIEKRDIENWIKNFSSSKEIAELILDNVIFYNTAQLKAYTIFLLNRLKEQVYMSAMEENHYAYIEDDALRLKWEECMSKSIFMPASLHDDPTSSAYKVIGYWRSVLKRGNNLISVIDDINEKYNEGIRRFILVDDFSGSGKQMLKVLNQKIWFENQETEVGKLAEIIEDIEIVIVVYVIHEEALKKINRQYSKIKVMYVDFLSNDFNYLNPNAFMYEKIDNDKINEITSEIKKIHEKIMHDNSKLHKLSTYVLNIPIVFEHGCPNNTLLLLFAQSNNWQQLFKRGEEI